MERTPVRALLEAIVGRTGLLECLEEGLTDKREIEDRLNKSRSTINRWLVDLREAGFITSEAEGHEVTVFGKIALQEYQRFVGRYDDLYYARSLLKYLPHDVDLDIRLLDGAEVLLSHEIAPQEPVLRLEEMVEKSESRFVRGNSPVVLPRYVDFFHDQVVNQGLQAEFAFEDQVLEYLLATYYQEVQDVLESGRGMIRRMDGAGPPFGMALIDDVGVWVGVYEPGGGLRGAIINSSQRAFEWGCETYEGIMEQSEFIEERDIMLRGGSARPRVLPGVPTKDFSVFNGSTPR